MRPREKLVVAQKYGRVPEAMIRYGVGESTLRKIAAAAHAVVKVGKVSVVDFDRMDAYMEELRQKQEA